jgi:hypothetical protein
MNNLSKNVKTLLKRAKKRFGERRRMQKITDQFELIEYENYKKMLVLLKVSTCQSVTLEYYTNYLYNYVYRYKMNHLEEVVKYPIKEENNECKDRNI